MVVEVGGTVVVGTVGSVVGGVVVVVVLDVVVVAVRAVVVVPVGTVEVVAGLEAVVVGAVVTVVGLGRVVVGLGRFVVVDDSAVVLSGPAWTIVTGVSDVDVVCDALVFSNCVAASTSVPAGGAVDVEDERSSVISIVADASGESAFETGAGPSAVATSKIPRSTTKPISTRSAYELMSSGLI